MKPNTTAVYYYTGDLYEYVLQTSADGTVTTRVYDEVPIQVQLSLSINLLGELIIESQTKMQLDAYIKNIVDRNGDEIYMGGEWQILQTAPILGPMGIKSGYKYRARIISGQI